MTTQLTRREFLKAGLGALASVALAPSLDVLSPSIGLPSDTPPNLIFILCDQLRACSTRPYGNTQVDTPNLDRLDSEGARFVNAVATSPVCSPSRACLLTGRYPNKSLVTKNNIKLRRGETCLAETFKTSNYQTGYIGKWHLNGETPDPLIDPGWVAPKDRQGFTKWSAFNVGHLYYDSHYYKDKDPTLLTIPEGMYEPDFQAGEAINFITDNQHRPFCLFVSFGIPHPGYDPDLPPGGDYTFPYDPNSLTLRPNVDYYDLDEARQEYADYYGMISNIDWNVGRILSTLDELGLTENTIVVFSSDHGDIVGSHYNIIGGLRAKQVIYTESLNVPFLLRYPPIVSPQRIEDVFVTVDIMPTLLGLCSLSVPTQVMGRDFSPTLISGAPPREPPYGSVPSSETVFVGSLDGRTIWVGVHAQEYTLECDRYTYLPTKLFDNFTDPYQMTNVVDDPDYAAIKEDLHQQLLAWTNYIGL